MSLKVSTLATTLGDYCRDFKQELLTKAVITAFVTQHLNLLTDITDELVLTELVIGDIVSPWSSAFQPKVDAIDLKPRILKTRMCKVDLQIVPKILFKTWLGKVKAPGQNPYNLPFEAFLMDHIAKKAKEQMMNKALFKGVYNAAGNTTAATLDGFLTLISAMILDLSIPASQVAATGAISDANGVDVFESIMDTVSGEYQNEPLKAFCSPAAALSYNRNYRTQYGQLPYNNEFKKVFIEGTQTEIVPVQGMAGSNRIFITPQENALYGTDLESDLEDINIEKEKRALNIMMDFAVGCQFAIADLVWTNDAA